MDMFTIQRLGLMSFLGTAVMVGACGNTVTGQAARTADDRSPKAEVWSARTSRQTETAIKFVRWVDPQERSFSVEVPAGWRVEGGVHWLSEIDPQAFVRVQSPDGKVRLFLGDPDLLTRQVPNQWSRMQTGVSEGKVFRTPTGGPALLQRFMTGAQYAKAHAAWRVCPQPVVVSSKDIPDVSRTLTQAIGEEARKWGATATANAGEIGFTCGTTQGAVFAATVLAAGRGAPMQMWMIYKLAGFESADPARSMEARYIMDHMQATLTTDPQWTARLEQRTREVTGAVISMQNAALQAQLAASRRQNETLAKLNHPNTFSPSSSSSSHGGGSTEGVNTILGTKRMCDAIGRCSTVSNDADEYYVDHGGNFRPGPAGGGPPDNSGVWSKAYIQ
jgi:hypothetical protein